MTATHEAVILPARPADLRAVYAIAERCFPLPWPLTELEKELSRPFSALRVLRPDAGSGVVGFANYWRVADELQLMNIAVDPERQRRGYGTALLHDVMRVARAEGMTAISLEVRRTNGPALRLYERHGFQHVGIRPHYYSDNREDALVLRLSLATL